MCSSHPVTHSFRAVSLVLSVCRSAMDASVALPSENLTDLEKRIGEAPHHRRFYTKLKDLYLREDHRSRFGVHRKKMNLLFTPEEKLSP